MEQALEYKTRLYESLITGTISKEEYTDYKARYTRIAENAKESIRVLKEKLADVLENRSERNRWISHFTQFSTMETLDRKAVVHMIQSIKVIGKKGIGDHLYIPGRIPESDPADPAGRANKPKKGGMICGKKKQKGNCGAPAPEIDPSCRAGVYVRLSVEDKHTHTVSIETQQLIIARYLEQNPEIIVVQTYIDNGATGTNFHRPRLPADALRY